MGNRMNSWSTNVHASAEREKGTDRLDRPRTVVVTDKKRGGQTSYILRSADGYYKERAESWGERHLRGEWERGEEIHLIFQTQALREERAGHGSPHLYIAKEGRRPTALVRYFKKRGGRLGG